VDARAAKVSHGDVSTDAGHQELTRTGERLARREVEWWEEVESWWCGGDVVARVESTPEIWNSAVCRDLKTGSRVTPLASSLMSPRATRSSTHTQPPPRQVLAVAGSKHGFTTTYRKVYPLGDAPDYESISLVSDEETSGDDEDSTASVAWSDTPPPRATRAVPDDGLTPIR